MWQQNFTKKEFFYLMDISDRPTTHEADLDWRLLKTISEGICSPIHSKWLLDIIWLTGIPSKHAWKGANFFSVVVFPVTWHPHYNPEITFIHFPSSMNLRFFFAMQSKQLLTRLCYFISWMWNHKTCSIKNMNKWKSLIDRNSKGIRDDPCMNTKMTLQFLQLWKYFYT